jgi:hypothetical protein
VEVVCSAGFAVAIFYKKMLVCCSAGVRVAVAIDIICLAFVNKMRNPLQTASVCGKIIKNPLGGVYD